ncbi:MAG: hypothetical protein FD143_3504 [Ignavibacteria bacterium]|nr:MAG: hypothetical protein FD143_3504 [Ignavibacteria bacterium]KAF0148315.1 MAG: hypothetical protein FD188_3509 [Ignavibacteria bacterium]
MKKFSVTTLWILFLFSSALLLFSCSASQNLENIFTPEVLYRSPNLDFTKVQAAAVMPVNCYSNEIPVMTGLVNDGLPAELNKVQTAWKIYSTDEVLRKLNDAGLGRGYQNYIADLNTFTSVAGMTPNFTSETQTFFNQLSKEMNFQTLLFTSYGFDRGTVQEKSTLNALLGGSGVVNVMKKRLSVTAVLYDLTSRRTWWIAKLTLTVNDDFPNEELARKVIEGICNNFGKGDLRQL